MKPTAVFGYKDTYNLPVPEDRFALLRQYPTDLIVMEVAKINSFLFHEPFDNKRLHQKVFSVIFPQLDDRRRKVIAAILAREIRDGYWPQFFASPPLSTLLSDSFSSFNHPPTDLVVNMVQFQQDLWDTILMYNQWYYGQVGGDDNLNTYTTQWKLGMMQQLYIRNINYVSLIGPTKVLLFYKFITTAFPEGRRYVEEFVNVMGLAGFFDYTLLAGQITSQTLSSYEQDQNARWHISLNEIQHKMIRHFSFRHADLATNRRINVHMNIMTHPFYYLMDEHPVILDFHYLNYFSEISLIYNFYHFTSLKNSELFPSFTSFKGMLGKSYYEEFMTGEIIRSIFSKKGFQVFDDAIEGFPDFAVSRFGSDLFLFEVKSSEVRMRVADELDANELKTFLDEQLASLGQGNARKKGIFQLINSIHQLVQTSKLDELLQKGSEKKKATIYPILIYTDPLLDIPCINSYINDIFQKEVAPYRQYFKKIFPVTLMNQTTLIDKYDLLKADPKILKDWIESFWKRNESNHRSYSKSGDPNQFLKAGISFTFFLNEILPGRDSLKYFRSIVQDLQLAHEDRQNESPT